MKKCSKSQGRRTHATNGPPAAVRGRSGDVSDGSRRRRPPPPPRSRLCVVTREQVVHPAVSATIAVAAGREGERLRQRKFMAGLHSSVILNQLGGDGGEPGARARGVVGRVGGRACAATRRGGRARRNKQKMAHFVVPGEGQASCPCRIRACKGFPGGGGMRGGALTAWSASGVSPRRVSSLRFRPSRRACNV